MTQTILVIAFPLLSCLSLMTGFRNQAAFIGVSGIILSFIATCFLWFTHAGLGEQHILWNFLPKDTLGFPLHFGFYVDSLSITMALVVTFVSSLIAIYSAEYMRKEEGIRRYFAGINLFVAFMLLLVLGDSLWLLFIGWEGVGLASYLLIGFYYRENQAVSAAMKAFLTTRVGDVFLLFGIFLCVNLFNTLDISSINALSSSLFPDGSFLVTITVLCFLGGAVGKSAQLPLQTWLADAMWGPTPVSALIHAATMVTAGVYLLARMSSLIELSYVSQMVILSIGLLTVVFAGIAALAQTDMKRVLAYSTMSQIGYMFAAVGALAFQAAIFHLVTHAFFKALLFLSAGMIGHSLHTYDLGKMGGLKKSLPFVYWMFLIGCISLIGLPLLSAGFFSKEWILGALFNTANYGSLAFGVAVCGTFLTGLYTFRMMSLAFFGSSSRKVVTHHTAAMTIPLLFLALASLGIGWLETPHLVGNIHVISKFLSSSLPVTPAPQSEESLVLWLLPTLMSIIGAVIALIIFRRTSSRISHASTLALFIKSGMGINSLYVNLLVKPYERLSRLLAVDVIVKCYDGFLLFITIALHQLSRLHTGRLSHYLSLMIFACVAFATVMVFS